MIIHVMNNRASALFVSRYRASVLFILNPYYSNTLARAAGAPLACMQLVNNVGDAVQNGVFRKHSASGLCPRTYSWNSGFWKRFPEATPEARIIVASTWWWVECLGGGEGEGWVGVEVV